MKLFHPVISLNWTSLDERDSQLRKCSILSIRVSLSDGFLQIVLGFLEEKKRWKAPGILALFFHRHSVDVKWGRRGVTVLRSLHQTRRPLQPLEATSSETKEGQRMGLMLKVDYGIFCPCKIGLSNRSYLSWCGDDSSCQHSAPCLCSGTKNTYHNQCKCHLVSSLTR